MLFGARARSCSTTRHSTEQRDAALVVSLSLEAKDVCGGPPTTPATFAYADYEPMAHGAEYDIAGERLFVTISAWTLTPTPSQWSTSAAAAPTSNCCRTAAPTRCGARSGM